jgi:hypothetical protein
LESFFILICLEIGPTRQKAKRQNIASQRTRVGYNCQLFLGKNGLQMGCPEASLYITLEEQDSTLKQETWSSNSYFSDKNASKEWTGLLTPTALA